MTPVGNLMTYWDSMGFPEMGDPQNFFSHHNGSFYAITMSFLGPQFGERPGLGRHVGRLRVTGMKAFSQDVLNYSNTAANFGEWRQLP